MINFIKAVKLNRKIRTTPILKFLSELHFNKTRSLDVGICYNLKRVYGATTDEMGQFVNLSTRWPNYSGNKDYPVPSPCITETDADYYLLSDNLWEGRQLEQRLSLINFVINHWES